MGDISNELLSYSNDSRNYPIPKSEVVHESKSIQQIPFNTCLGGDYPPNMNTETDFLSSIQELSMKGNT